MYRVVGIGFDHMHMGDQLRIAAEAPDAELVGVIDSDRDRMAQVCNDVGLAEVEQVIVTDADAALDRWKPDIAIVCSTTAAHREWVERLAPRHVHVQLEKPFGTSVTDVDAMIGAAQANDIVLGVNWPLAWYRTHRTTHRIVGEGRIGAVREVHFYDGNRGPLRHVHDKREVEAGAVDPRTSWWYSKAAGGGSLRDYLGYGTTLGTWFRGGGEPSAVTAVAHIPTGFEVDEQSIVVAAYENGLSLFQTRWGTFTDPWTHQPQPRCGFVVVGESGSVASWDYDDGVTVQDGQHLDGERVPLDDLPPELSTGLGQLLHCLDTGAPLDDLMGTAIGRTGQLMVDAAVVSSEEGRTVRIAAGQVAPA